MQSLQWGEYNRFSKGIFGWIGFRTKWLPYQNVERVAGETKWSFWKLFKYSLQGIIAFSTAPLAIASVAGILICLVAFLMVIGIIVKTLLWGRPGRRVAVSGLHDYVYEWNSAFVHWDPGTIFGKDVLRNKASSHLPCCGDE